MMAKSMSSPVNCEFMISIVSSVVTKKNQHCSVTRDEDIFYFSMNSLDDMPFTGCRLPYMYCSSLAAPLFIFIKG